ncbi:DUF443 family protein [Streptococcus oricebi]|uniref:Tandem five-TM protein n=1 Tax=Streptococcus oricebi TaxID=1547447 RepID=A0ABS5B187_9STRE|nr:DUF443 family protein [Streptococcus oricebi]MBP2622602.1 hypothetical protein [Streptococcus oricebi]
MIQLATVNSRYLIFKSDGNYYLLDRKPVNFLCYFFFPLSWLFKQKLYIITEGDFQHILFKNQQASNFVVPFSLIGGLGFLLTTVIRRSGLLTRLETDLSIQTNLLFFALVFLLSLVFVQTVYYVSKKRLFSKLALTEITEYKKIVPKTIKNTIAKRIFAVIMLWLLTILCAFTYIYSGNWFFLWSVFFMLCFMFMLGNASYTIDVIYKMSDN